MIDKQQMQAKLDDLDTLTGEYETLQSEVIKLNAAFSEVRGRLIYNEAVLCADMPDDLPEHLQDRAKAQIMLRLTDLREEDDIAWHAFDAARSRLVVLKMQWEALVISIRCLID